MHFDEVAERLTPRRVRSRHGLVWVLVAAASLATAAPAAAGNTVCPAATSSTAVQCDYTGAGTYAFTVPTGVSSIGVVAVGAAGGVGVYGGAGGDGASVRDMAVPVKAGQSLSVVVGGQGQDAPSDSSGSAICGGAGGSPGGGGAGGSDQPECDSFDVGGGGGGYSGVFQLAGRTPTPLVIAGAGGGSGGGGTGPGGNGDTGNGGGIGTFGPGTEPPGGGVTPNPANGTCSASSGTAGLGSGADHVGDGRAGSYLSGGAGGAEEDGYATGGGGGGGYCGGGGGGADAPYEVGGSGAGGSSYGVTGLTNETVSTAPASVTITLLPAQIAVSAVQQPDATWTVYAEALRTDGSFDTDWQDASPTWTDPVHALGSQTPAPFVNGVSTTTGIVLEGNPTASDTITVATAGVTGTSNDVTVAAAPKNTKPPVISGTLAYGDKLTSSTGAWTSSSSLSHAYQWYSCVEDFIGSCAPIAGATHSYLTLGKDQIGQYVTVKVTVTDKAGVTASAYSAISGLIPAPTPVQTSQPSITGTAQDGQTLTAHRPTWSDPAPMSYTYAWYACTNQTASSCQVIAGKTSYTLKLSSAQVGDYIEAVMTADAEGSTANANAFTASTVAAPAAPVNATAPTISGSTNTGAKATVTTGKWTSPDTLTYTYQWYRCTGSAQSTCTTISGAHSNTHTRTAADNGDTLAAKVTATDTEGQSTSITVLQS